MTLLHSEVSRIRALMESYEVTMTEAYEARLRDHVARGGHLCPQCGAPSTGLCRYHLGPVDEDAAWSRANRLLCNFVHRGIVPPRPPVVDPLGWWWEGIAP